MPYATVADLPPAIRRRYGDCAKVFRGAFNSAYAEHSDESRAFAIAHAAAQRCQQKESSMAVDIQSPPDIEPGPKFTIITRALSATPPSGDGKRRFRAVASSTVEDLAGDQISVAALQKAAAKFRAGVGVFMDHDYKHVGSRFGVTDTAEVVQRGMDERTGKPVYDLEIGGFVDTFNPTASQLADSIDSGLAKLGASITAFVRKHVRNAKGAMDIDDIEPMEVSIVGVPMNQRSWAQKAALAIKSYGYKEEAQVDDNDQPDAGAESVVEKAAMSAESRNNLDDSDFACPEKRKYPINDAAHVRAALSRIADPSNDQCGRDKIIAAARRMGIGEHAKGLTDDALVLWAGSFSKEIVSDGQGQGHEIIVKEFGEYPENTGTNAADEAADAAPDGQESAEESDEAKAESETPAGETPETASDSTDDAADAPEVEKAYSPEDVRELLGHVRNLVQRIGDQEAEIAVLRTKVASYEAEAGTLTNEVNEAKEVIERVLAMPLRPRTAGYVEEFTATHSLFDPDIAEYLNKRSKLSNGN